MYAWTHLPLWVRAGSALIMLSISTSMLMRGVLWYWGWAGGAILLFFTFVKPIGPNPWKQYDAGPRTELPPVPRLDGSSPLKESPEEVLAKIRAARGDQPKSLQPRYETRKPSGIAWLVGGAAVTVFFALAVLYGMRAFN